MGGQQPSGVIVQLSAAVGKKRAVEDYVYGTS